MQQCGLVAIERRIEPEPAFGREVRLHHHVGNQEVVLEHPADEVEAHHGAGRRTGAVAGDQPVGLKLVRSVRGIDGERDMVVLRRDADDLVAAADLDRLALCFQFPKALVEIKLEIILLQVDEGRAAVALFGQQVEAVDLALVEEDLAGVPDDALVDHGIAAAEAVEDFQRALGEADGARAPAHLVVVVEDENRHVLLGQVDRGPQTDRTGTDDNDRMTDRLARVLVGGPLIGIERRFEDF